MIWVCARIEDGRYEQLAGFEQCANGIDVDTLLVAEDELFAAEVALCEVLLYFELDGMIVGILLNAVLTYQCYHFEDPSTMYPYLRKWCRRLNFQLVQIHLRCMNEDCNDLLGLLLSRNISIDGLSYRQEREKLDDVGVEFVVPVAAADGGGDDDDEFLFVEYYWGSKRHGTESEVFVFP